MIKSNTTNIQVRLVGHFFFEHNKPATFKYPVYSFLGDWVMLKDFLLGRFRKG
ncbi:Mpo1-like protein [Endozoicomonas sp. ALB115]|uniref:Mpo1-like protein n=1 Tax=Endozoicomonas sp. ALB115 TaxID=3403074 RepID=UPI003BB6B3EC